MFKSVMIVLSFFIASVAIAEEKPKLILQITVDQLRADLPLRHMDKFGEDGFKRLYSNGTVFRNAFHPHANNETVVGHTTISTGTFPSLHGMVGNVWFDKSEQRKRYNIEDAKYPLLDEDAGVDKAVEVDHTQKAAKSSGRSPRAILTSTFTDELSLATHNQAKIYAVSVKDRGAVTMAGHAGKAFWFSKSKGKFITSRYYFDAYPQWVTDWNESGKVSAYAGTNWELSLPFKDYSPIKDNRRFETPLGDFGTVFPHAYGDASGKLYNTLLTMSPAGDELTLSFALSLLKNENLGKDKITDYLGISFSSTDYVGHLFGPGSLETEDNLVRLDKTLAKLFDAVDKEVGLDNVLVVLSADHGGSEAPKVLGDLGLDADYVYPGAWDNSKEVKALKAKYGVDKLIESFANPYVYINPELLKAHSDDVVSEIANVIEGFSSVTYAVPNQFLKSDLLSQEFPFKQIKRNYHPQRSGDIYVVFKPNYFINAFSGLTVAATHGSPWRYDSYVPIVFMQKNQESKQVYRKVSTVDIAVTLSQAIGIKPPSAAVGEVLYEVFEEE